MYRLHAIVFLLNIHLPVLSIDLCEHCLHVYIRFSLPELSLGFLSKIYVSVCFAFVSALSYGAVPHKTHFASILSFVFISDSFFLITRLSLSVKRFLCRSLLLVSATVV